jgi:hypothetical protein
MLGRLRVEARVLVQGHKVCRMAEAEDAAATAAVVASGEEGEGGCAGVVIAGWGGCVRLFMHYVSID